MNNVENNNRLSADFSAFMQRLASGQGVDGEVSIKSEKTENGVTLTVTRTGSGDPVVKTYEIPELDESKFQDKSAVMASLKSFADKVPPETFQKLHDTFVKFCRELEKAYVAGGGVPPKNDTHAQTMFDIYALLRLLQDVGQTLKNTARESREAALQSDMALIRSEASIQKTAAIDGFIMTVAISVGMCMLTIGLCSSGAKASSKAYKLEKKAAAKPKTPAAEAQPASKDASAVNKDEKVDKTEKEEKVDGGGAEKGANVSGKSGKAQGEDNAEKIQSKRENDIKKEEEDEQIVEEESGSKQTEQKVKADKTEVKEKGLEDKKEAKADKEKATDEKKDQELKEEEDQPTPDGEEIAAGEKKSNLTEEEEDELFSATAKSQKQQLYAQLSMMAGQSLGGLGQSVQQIMSAEGTLLEADQRKAEALRDELTEIMQDAQAVISAVKDLRESIIQSESQSIDTILRA